MQTVKWNDGWLFWDARTPENKKRVWLPHDAMLQEQRLANIQNGVATGFFPGGMYYYSKPLFGKPEYENQTVILEFEGVYMNSTVLCNGEKVGGRIYGYSDFYADLTGKLRIGEENEILVIADNTHTPNSRWYSGSGIYRDVYLVTGSKKHIMPDGISVRTVSIDPAVLQITVETSDNEGKAAVGETERKTVVREAGIAGAKESIRVEIYDGSRMVATGEGSPCSITVPNAKLWSAEEPNIYEVKVYLLENGETVDTASVRTGIRCLTSEVSADGEVKIAFTVKNTGTAAGEEVAQLYVQDVAASMLRPSLEFAGCCRVALEAGEEKRVTMRMKASQFAFLNQSMQWVVEAGEMKLFVGASSDDLRLRGSFRILDTKIIDARKRGFYARQE